MTMSPEQWRAISPLLAEAMDLPESAREAWLAGLDRQQPALSPLVRMLLAADRRAEAGQVFDTASVLVGTQTRRPTDLDAGQLVGPYRLSRPLGYGGMGEVWLARQVEGGITRDVALKLPALLGNAGVWRERFRRERDILARLQHPNIATLFDAGVADVAGTTGQPYLAMEYVDGTTLVEHATERRLPVRERILLFRQVLAAVGCAHRQLVIHRDIKPSNILVTAEGVAKLLDFGIAKLLEDDATATVADDLTRLGGRLLTFRYAAPEQVHGEALSTATDVYALGVVLHELLTGKSPYSRVRDGAAPGLADFQQQDFALPSSLTIQDGIAGDLDAVVLKALRRSPADRYGTVEQFDDDLGRHLARQPVLARHGSRRYRVGRFILRHRLPLVAAAATTVSLLTGLAIAEHQRREAVAAQLRAERHFASVRELANTFIYDIEEDLRGLAGTLPVREKLAGTSVKYLDTLASEDAVDPALIAELAGGYRRVGEVYGGVGNGNLGNTEAAIQNLLKAEALFDTLNGQGTATRRNLDDQRRVHYALVSLFFSRDDPRWEEQFERAIAVARRLADEPGATPYDQVTAAGLLLEYLQQRYFADRVPQRNSPLLDEAKTRLLAVAPRVGPDVRARGNLAISQYALAQLLVVPGATAEELQNAYDGLQTALTMLRALEREVPDDIIYAAQADMVQSTQVEVLLQMDRAPQAEAAIASILAGIEARSARDPHDNEMSLKLWQALTLGAESAFRTGQMTLAAQRAQQSWRIVADLPEGTVDIINDSPVSVANADYFGGLALLALGNGQRPLACRHLRAVEAFLPQFRKEMPDLAADPRRFAELQPALQRCPAPATAVSSAAR
jgi:serine/threonine protein kinase